MKTLVDFGFLGCFFELKRREDMSNRNEIWRVATYLIHVEVYVRNRDTSEFWSWNGRSVD